MPFVEEVSRKSMGVKEWLFSHKLLITICLIAWIASAIIFSSSRIVFIAGAFVFSVIAEIMGKESVFNLGRGRRIN